MKIKQLILLGTTLIALSPLTAFGAEVVVRWTNPSAYSDIHQAKRDVNDFRRELFTDLGQHFAKLAKQLPADQVLDIEITDVDLAGSVQRESGNQVRYYQDNFKPAIILSYQLLDDNRNVLSSDNVRLKDARFLDTTHRRLLRLNSTAYEKHMISNWFDKTFM